MAHDEKPLNMNRPDRGAMRAFQAQITDERVFGNVGSDDDMFETVIVLALDEYQLDIQNLAKRTGFTVGNINKWKKGKTLPPSKDREKIVEAIHDEIDDVLKPRTIH